MLRILFYFCFILFCFTAKAQFSLSLTPENHREKCDDFYVAEVSDQRKQSGSIGQVFNPGQKKEEVYIRNNPEKALLHYLRSSFRQDQKGIPVHIRIDECWVTESAKASNRVKGEMKFALSAYAIKDGNLSRIGEAHSKSSYERAAELNPERELSEEMRKMVDNAFVFIIRNIDKNKGGMEAFIKESSVEILPFFVEENPDTLYYQSRKIVWADFKGDIHTASRYGAAIFTNFSVETEITVENRHLKARVRPKVFMDKNMSWAKSAAKSYDGLKHEQLHFDITYLVVLEYLDKIKDFKAETADDLSSMIQYEYLEYYRKMNKMQEQYDGESQHSLNRGKQQEWENKVNQELRTRP